MSTDAVDRLGLETSQQSTPATPLPAFNSPYSALPLEHNHNESTWGSRDPRTSSNQSLVPSLESQGTRRTLLLIYCHGFMGDETSFQSFPAHVHNLLKALLVDSHIVHTKIYPRYRSRKAMQIATEDFSTWLTPHESPNTDIVLLGHSMGGMLAAEVALLPSRDSSTHTFRHRLLGTVNLDVPFLGLHPGIIKAGLSSLFRPAGKLTDKSLSEQGILSQESLSQSTSSLDTTSTLSPAASFVDAALFSPQPEDPNYNPVYENDVKLPVRKGWRNAWHFINKHSNDLLKGSQQWLTSHYEFGSVLADYKGLKLRYAKIRRLEEENDKSRQIVLGSALPVPRVRFVNYYTASTGRPKKQKPISSEHTLDPDTTDHPSLDLEHSELVTPSSHVHNDNDIANDLDSLTLLTESQSSTSTPDSRPTSTTLSTEATSSSLLTASTTTTTSSTAAASSKSRTFCLLPSHDSAWIQLLMPDMDQVEAHCGLFFVSERYAQLVGEVAERIERWVADDASERVVRDMGGSGA